MLPTLTSKVLKSSFSARAALLFEDFAQDLLAVDPQGQLGEARLLGQREGVQGLHV
jgi:hypothetical protein